MVELRYFIIIITSCAGQSLDRSLRADFSGLTLSASREVGVAEAQFVTGRVRRSTVLVRACVERASTAEPTRVAQTSGSSKPDRFTVRPRLTRQTLVDGVGAQVGVVVASRAREVGAMAGARGTVVSSQTVCGGVIR